jgi:hypothetical protein
MKSVAAGRHLSTPPPRWDPDFIHRSPMFEPLHRAAAELKGARWPSLADLDRLARLRPEPARSASGAPIRFVAQGARPRRRDDRYEARIYLRGEVQVREANWHDLLNALVWLTFPRAKAALNARHYQALLEQEARGARNRGPVQDALTLFDEGGVIVAAGEGSLLRMIERFQWKELFWQERERVTGHMRFCLFGHALFEKALHPFTGITGRAMLLHVAPALLDAPLPARIDALDEAVAGRLRDPQALRATRDLAPLPILGVPGWCEENARPDYYDDAAYFRRGRGNRSAD